LNHSGTRRSIVEWAEAAAPALLIRYGGLDASRGWGVSAKYARCPEAPLHDTIEYDIAAGQELYRLAVCVSSKGCASQIFIELEIQPPPAALQ
jgi:hypothetical protein